MPERKRGRSKATEPKLEPSSGRYAYSGLDRVLHEKARLGIMTSLFTHPEGLLFSHLKECCSLTDGNLSRHLQILNEAKLVDIWKGFEGRRPQTLCRLSLAGKNRFLRYVEELERDPEAFLRDTAGWLESSYLWSVASMACYSRAMASARGKSSRSKRRAKP